MTRMSPNAFADVLRIKVPATIAAHRNEFVFAVTTKAHRELVRATPVDTGYLVNGLSLTVVGEAPVLQPARAANATAKQYHPGFFDGMAIPRALASGRSLLLSFQASYAPFVEDKRHMVKQTKAKMEAIVRDAVALVVGRHK